MLVFGRLAQLGTRPANLCSDEVFVRRAFLDVIGTLPTSVEVRAFLSDRSPTKRAALIDKLLARDEYADYWAMKWADLLRIKSEFPVNLWPMAAQGYHRWVHDRMRENQPYDKFVRDILTSSGSNFRVPQVNFFRAVTAKKPEGMAQGVALTFMGIRTDKWPKDKLSGMAAFFSQIGYKGTGEWKEEIVFWDPSKAVPAPDGGLPIALCPDGTRTRLAATEDPRAHFADWLISPQNPWFGTIVVNRIWSWLLGRGIIEEPDDIRPDNPPSNPALLTYLHQELFAGNCDLKHIMRLVLNSNTYQLSSVPAVASPTGEANFAHYTIRRLDAEVIIDAVDQLTGSMEGYSSATPEPFTFIPEDQRSIALADGSITSAFLELFGRPARDTGMAAERNNRPSPAQRLHMFNSSHMQRKIDRGPKIIALLQSTKSDRDLIDEIYLSVLSRFPTTDEVAAIDEYVKRPGANRTDAAQDVIWSLVNSAEFLYRH
jgi:hypothetical protein